MAVQTFDYPKFWADLNRDGYAVYGNPVDKEGLSVVGVVRGNELHLEAQEQRMTTYANESWPLSEYDFTLSIDALLHILEIAYGNRATASTA